MRSGSGSYRRGLRARLRPSDFPYPRVGRLGRPSTVGHDSRSSDELYQDRPRPHDGVRRYGSTTAKTTWRPRSATRSHNLPLFVPIQGSQMPRPRPALWDEVSNFRYGALCGNADPGEERASSRT